MRSDVEVALPKSPALVSACIRPSSAIASQLPTPSSVAETAVLPSPTAVTRPSVETVATVASAALHTNVPPETVAPLVLVALADSWTVAPTEFNVAVPGDTETVATASVGPGQRDLEGDRTPT